MTSTFSSEMLGFLSSAMFAPNRRTGSQIIDRIICQMQRSSYALISIACGIQDPNVAPIMHKLVVAGEAPVHMRGRESGVDSERGIIPHFFAVERLTSCMACRAVSTEQRCLYVAKRYLWRTTVLKWK